MEATFPAGFLDMVSKVVYGLFLYALQPANRTSASFMGAILKEFLVNSMICLKVTAVKKSFSRQVLKDLHS